MSTSTYLEVAMAGDRAEPMCPLRREVAAAGLSPRGFAQLLELGIPVRALAQLCGAGGKLKALLRWGGLPRVKEMVPLPVRRGA
ncbi:hypothetical protein [Qipengyuania atrilutea]|uniref:Uncharacterized protein n=1 Tax=Qipengyuania atrilutea TaxID=2744473 RepID=A0A850H888_9SPHN|nr:hypothetical protein [Actirhodobacter atriluteus]NVD46058.1 hypothetical protein [Actirhodobacter atriluteus]